MILSLFRWSLRPYCCVCRLFAGTADKNSLCPIAILIDELKHENVQLWLNSMKQSVDARSRMILSKRSNLFSVANPPLSLSVSLTIQKRSGGITSRRQALFEAQEYFLAKNITARAEAADRIQQPELAALAILTCAWDGCNLRATVRCPWCRQEPYCSLEHQILNHETHRAGCRAGAMYR